MPSSQTPENEFVFTQKSLFPFTPLEIYQQFHVPENLQQHMLWVASFGSIVCESVSAHININTEIILAALLLHDLGNLVKYDFNRTDLLSPADRSRITQLQKHQALLRAQFGNHPDSVTAAFLKQAKLPHTVRELVESMDMANMEKVVTTGSWEERIARYADLRVGPHGVISVQERIDDAYQRYPHLQANIQAQAGLCTTLEDHLSNQANYPLSQISPEEVTKKIPEIQVFDFLNLR